MDDVRQLLSVQSLLLDLRFSGTHLAHGTGFVVSAPSGAPVLLTARHNLTGRHPATGSCLDEETQAVPDEVMIAHNRRNHLGQRIERVEPLWSEHGSPLWIEHPRRRDLADVAGLKLTQLDDEVVTHPLRLQEVGFGPIVVGPADTVSVIGFPFGRGASGCYGIWATGFVATDPEYDYDGLPMFLIDCRSRQGQSGSPVVAYRPGGVVSFEGGGTEIAGEPVYNLLGLYTGRINPESDLGMVWKVSLLGELIESIR